MRFFIFPLDSSVYIGVEAERVKRLISSNARSDAADETAGGAYGIARGDAADSSPDHGLQLKIPFGRIFRGFHSVDDSSFHHGIVLKRESGDNKTLVIITPPVERDINVEEKEIRRLPKSFSGIYSSFNGVYFNEQKIVFFLDVEKLAKRNFGEQETE